MYGCFHHAVGDGWSVNLAMGQLYSEYVSGVFVGDDAGVQSPSYLDAVRAEREYRGSPDWTADREYFVERYRDVGPALFARRCSWSSRRRQCLPFMFNPARAPRIRDTGRSVFAFTVAALGEYLHRVHRGGDIILGVPFLNRSSDAELRTVGCVVNMLPVRVPIDSSASTVELADRVNGQVWELQARQRFAYGDIVSAVQESVETPSTLFDVTYSYHTIPDDERAQGLWKNTGVLASGTHSMRSTSSFVTTNGTVRSRWTCSTLTMSSTRTIGSPTLCVTC